MNGEAFHASLRTLRSNGPVARVEELDAWMVLDRSLAIEVLRDAARYTVDDPRFSTGRVLGPNMLSLDGATHVRHREPFVSGFKLGGAVRDGASRDGASRDGAEARLRRTVDRLLEPVRAQGNADLQKVIAAPFAVQVMSDALGLVDVHADELLGWYSDIVDSVTVTSLGEEPHDAGRRAMELLRSAVGRSVEASPLLADAAKTLTLDEVTSNAAVLLFGGLETTEAMIAIACAHILARPDVLQRVRDDRRLLRSVVEESVRLEPAAARLDRYTSEPVVLGRHHLPVGSYVLVSVAAANRDPAFFANPETFELDRANSHQHVSFAQGPHACLATHLAKAQTAAVLDAILDLSNVSLAAPVDIVGEVFRKPMGVQVQWELPTMVARPLRP